MKRLVLLLVIVFVAMGAVQAQTEWDEVEEYYKEEFRDNLKKAQAGDAFAMYVVGHFYKDGWGVEKNGQEAFKWSKKSAELGCAEGMYVLGECYRDGVGVAKNIDETIKWWSKAADKGYVNALFNLAWLYSSEKVGTFDMYKGNEIPKNPDEAFRLWKILGEQREAAGGMYSLGNCYWYGEGVGRSYKEAVKWWQKAARKDFKQAQEALKKIDETW